MLLILLFNLPSAGQENYYSSFTVADGLPSNHIYRCVEDDKGYLWVATDAGIARFDGKHFQVFTTEQGLPDNEVLEVLKEKNGTIWINCFKQSPAYFDETKNRFINAKEDPNLAKVSGTANMQMFTLKDGGIVYNNEKGCFAFKDKKLVYQSYYTLIGDNEAGSWLQFRTYQNKTTFKSYLVLCYKDGRADSVLTGLSASRIAFVATDQNNLYNFHTSNHVFYCYHDIQTGSLNYTVDSVQVPEPFFSYCFTNSSIVVLSNTAKVYLYDKHSLHLKQILKGDYLPNGVYDDSKGNIWVCTIDKGLLVYRKKQLDRIALPHDFIGTNFLSITRKPDGTLLAGNYYGQVIEAGKGKFKVHSVVNKKPSRLKKIILSGKNIYTISDAADGIFVNYSKKLIQTENKTALMGGKTGLACNDTLILIGTSYGILRLNTTTKTVNHVTRYNRVTALTKINNNEVYVGSTDGLHKYNFVNQVLTSLTQKNVLLSERITGLCTTPDGLTWASTSGNGVIVVQSDSVLLHITDHDGIISNSCRSITSTDHSQVWLGTSYGISVIDYHMQNGIPKFSIRNFTENDGLTSNEINEMFYDNDTMYAATGNGISIIPLNTSFPQINIPSQLIRMIIDQRDTIITNNYTLGYKQQNIQMQFAGIELNGHFKNLQYCLDENRNWTNLADNTLTLQLNNGSHTVQIRAIDINGNTSNKILTLHFSIATPFWKTWWFWILVGLTLQVVTFYLVNHQQKKRKEQRLAKELAIVQTASLEQQAFTSLMNPHFMFNALNSIQHYINVQDRKKANHYLSDFASLIRKNFEAAQQSFIPLEQELENIKIYLRLEQMRFTNRFSYEIHVDVRIDTEQSMIPTMMLQPVLENALLHGILPSTIEGKLLIQIEQKNNYLKIIITDNGIGIENSLSRRQQNSHRSRGMELIQKRIQALNQLVKESVQFISEPAISDPDNPGNRITILIPLTLYDTWLQVQ
jgi:ligand-binding sensor domain-containing protein/two-component sensor histidine kinase